MADNALIKIMTALLKHQVKKLMGEDAMGIVGQELTAIGGDKLDERIKSLLGEKTTAEELEKAATYALDSFHGKVNDNEVEQWMTMLPLHNLPSVVSAFEELPTSPDETKLEKALRESIALNWKGISSVQVDKAVNAFLYSLRSALLPLEKQTLMVIGRSVLRTEEKTNQLIHLFEQFITANSTMPSGMEIGGNVRNSNIIVGNNNIINSNENSPSIQATAPKPLGYFVGRENILTVIKSILINDTQSSIVAITGMGGVGKTSLAIQIAHDVKDKFIGNIFWGDLNESQGTVIPILELWATYCGQPLLDHSNPKKFANLVRGCLSKRRESQNLLVVIDDLRQEWLESGEVLLKAIPENVPVLITTRDDEVVQRFSIAKIFNLDEHPLLDSEAYELLKRNSENAIGDSEVEKIAKLCANIPLALDIAAQVARGRDVHYLLRCLESESERIVKLEKGSKRLKEESVKITFDISYNALSDEKKIMPQMVFRHLGIFAPVGITAEHLKKASANSGNDLDMEESLYRLKEHSLIQSVGFTQETHKPIYRMHALLHDYASSLLTDEEATEARQGHLACFQNFAQSYADVNLSERSNSRTQEFELFYPQMMQALTNFEQEYKLKDSKLKNTQLRSAIGLIDILDKYWTLPGDPDKQDKWLEIVLNQNKWLEFAFHISSKIHWPLKQADLARRVGRVKGWQAELDEGLEWMKRCESTLINDISVEANAIRALMYIHRASLEYQKEALETAEADCKCGLDMVTTDNQPRIYAEGYNLLGVIKIRTNQLPQALELFEKSLSAWKQVGDQYQVNRTEENYRSALYYLGDIAQLRAAEEESLQYWKQFPNHIQYAAALTNRGLVRYIDEEYGTAVELHQHAMELSNTLGSPRMRALTRLNLAWPYISLGKYDQAENLLNESLNIQEEYDIQEFWIDAKRCLAEVEIGRKNYINAIELAEIAVNLAKENDDPMEEGAALRVLGQACHLNGDLKQASKHLKKSLALLRKNEYKHESYLTLQALGKLYSSMGDTKKAQATFIDAQSLATEMGLRKD